MNLLTGDEGDPRNGADDLNNGSAAVTMTRNVRVRDMHSVFQLLELVMDRGTAPLMDPRNPNSGTCLVAITKCPNPTLRIVLCEWRLLG